MTRHADFVQPGYTRVEVAVRCATPFMEPSPPDQEDQKPIMLIPITRRLGSDFVHV